MTILLIEDDITFSGMLEAFLSSKNYGVKVTHRGRDGLRLFKSHVFDLVLLDYRLPDGNGMEFLHQIKNHSRDIPVIIMTSFNDVRTAVVAIQSGATDYILKPVNPDELLVAIKRASTSEDKMTETMASEHFIEGEGLASKKLHEYVHLVAPTDLSVIIEGESGTGKERIARMIHGLSPRANAPFIALDCGSISKEIAASELFGHVKGSFTGAIADKLGKFEAANNGTLFLDEVGNLSYEIQVKLLRAIQERVIQRVGSNQSIKVNVRIITATNDDLIKSVKQGNFREDLFHRLNEFTIKVPSLRERGDDLIQFAGFFLKQANSELNRTVDEFSPEVLDLFRKHTWPGNLRELRNVVRRAVLLSKETTIYIDCLPPEMGSEVSLDAFKISAEVRVSPYDLKVLHEDNERELITKTLQEVGFNKSKAARMLNIDRKTLYSKMEKYNIE